MALAGFTWVCLVPPMPIGGYFQQPQSAKGKAAKGSNPSGVKVWVTPPGKPRGPTEVLAVGEKPRMDRG